MKILIICGCLEPGKDGVGDYSRLLGTGLIRNNHQVMLLSLHDHYAMPPKKILKGNSDAKLQLRRISTKHNRTKRGSMARAYISRFDPEWISLQYVPYSFHSKGMDLRLPEFFSKLKGPYKWHFMVHEPWVTSDQFFSKGTVIGYIQKRLLRLLVNNLSPELVHTSNPYYQQLLRQEGLRSELLHLPGNIPVAFGASDLLKKEFSELGITKATRKQWLLLGTFGRIRPDVSYKELLGRLLQASEAVGKKIAFLSIGNAGPFVDCVIEEIRTEYREQVLLHKFGHKEVAEISAFFQWLDYGIASVPSYLLGKSGAYSAMRNHSLKVLVPQSREWKKNGYMDAFFSEYLQKIPDEDFSFNKVAQVFLHGLSNSVINEKELQHEHFVYNA